MQGLCFAPKHSIYPPYSLYFVYEIQVTNLSAGSRCGRVLGVENVILKSLYN